jgi:hypothetical protein
MRRLSQRSDLTDDSRVGLLRGESAGYTVSEACIMPGAAMKRRPRRYLLASRTAGALALVGALGCSGADEEARINVTCPPHERESFGLVSSVLEERCGTLDCHGSFHRPLRIFGQNGLRRPLLPDDESTIDVAEYFPGGKQVTTDAELADNVRSICGLEPELMTQVVTGSASPEDLLLVKKARLREKHKGGRVWDKGSDGDHCITSWLVGSAESGKCTTELQHP